jgi:hypothetical protein
MQTFALALGASRITIHAIFHNDLGLVKKLVHWVPKMLSEETVRTRWQMVKLIREKGREAFGQFVAMGESTVSFQTPKIKK